MNYVPVLLLVDPEAKRRQVLAEGLQGDAFRLQSADNFRDAWQLVQKQTPNLIFCAGVPLFDEALELCQKVKRFSPGMPFIVYAVQDDEAMRLHFLETGADEFLSGESVVDALRQVTMSSATEEAVSATGQMAEQQMYFRLKPGEIGNILQFLNFSARSGHLDLKFTGTPPSQATIWLTNGEVSHLEYTGLEDLEAMAMILNAGEAEAQFYDETAALPPGTLKLPLSQLLIEATVLADENHDAQSIMSDPARIPQRLLESCPSGLEPDAAQFWERIDGVSSITDLVEEDHPRTPRSLRILKKLLDLKALQLTAPDKAEITPEKRLEAWLGKIRRQFRQNPNPEYQKSLFAHLRSLYRGNLSPDQYLNVSMRNFPQTLSIQHATCCTECGNQALLVEGSRLECSCCGTLMLARNGVAYVLKDTAAGR